MGNNLMEKVKRNKNAVCIYASCFFLIVILSGGVQLSPHGTAATNRTIVPAPDEYDDGEFGGIIIGGGNISTPRKPAPVPLCHTQKPHAARTRTRVAAVGSQRLTARAMALPAA
jgi:hypothetical protein